MVASLNYRNGKTLRSRIIRHRGTGFSSSILGYHGKRFRSLIHSHHLHSVPSYTGGTRWRSWLKHCATNRKVAGSISDGVSGITHRHNPFGRTTALGSTQPVTEMNTRNMSWGGGVKAAGE
jgi:hypothetical protein